ncbi:MAG: metal-dependent transcriptional regulator, partial [Candidatus Izemoplasmatales bacterium]|jgi:Mn-dependent DtxR family transcriptional regulator
LVRAIDVAKELEYSKPSVSRALKQLGEAGCITIESNGNILFTECGRELANRNYYRHKFFADFLLFLGVDETTAKGDACKLEHVLSPESYQAIKKYINNVRNNG